MSRAELKTAAKTGLKGNWGVAILAVIVSGLIMCAASMVFGIGQLIITGPVTVGLCVVFSSIARGEKTEFVSLFNGFKNFVNTFLTGLLHTLFIALWSLLFCIPGIVKSYSYAMTFFIQKDHPEMSGTEAITASREMMQGHKWELFVLDLSFIGWYCLVGLTFGLLSFYVVPYHNATRAAYYEKLKAAQ